MSARDTAAAWICGTKMLGLPLSPVSVAPRGGADLAVPLLLPDPEELNRELRTRGLPTMVPLIAERIAAAVGVRPARPLATASLASYRQLVTSYADRVAAARRSLRGPYAAERFVYARRWRVRLTAEEVARVGAAPLRGTWPADVLGEPALRAYRLRAAYACLGLSAEEFALWALASEEVLLPAHEVAALRGANVRWWEYRAARRSYLSFPISDPLTSMRPLLRLRAALGGWETEPQMERAARLLALVEVGNPGGRRHDGEEMRRIVLRLLRADVRPDTVKACLRAGLDEPSVWIEVDRGLPLAWAAERAAADPGAPRRSSPAVIA